MRSDKKKVKRTSDNERGKQRALSIYNGTPICFLSKNNIIETQEIDLICDHVPSMADIYLRCDKCFKQLKTFLALVKHFEKCHVNRPVPKRATFFKDKEEVQLIAAQAIQSLAVQGEYKAWFVGLVERLNGIHHQKHKRKYILVATK